MEKNIAESLRYTQRDYMLSRFRDKRDTILTPENARYINKKYGI